MVPPKKSEEKEPKKRTEDGQMGYLRTRITRENAFDKKKREIKKWKTSLQLARWRLEYNPVCHRLWGKGVLAGPLLSALMWVPFDFLFIFLSYFGRGSPLLNGGILKRQTTLDSTKVFASRPNYSQLYIPCLTSTALNKSNGKRLCKKISLLINKCDTMIKEYL